MSKDRDWIEWHRQAREMIEGRSLAELRRERSFYDDTDGSGHVYWWIGGDVAAAPVSASEKIDLDNLFLAGEDQGAEPDLYGRTCQVMAALADRLGETERAAEFRVQADRYFRQAEETGCRCWSSPEEIPPVGP